MLKVMHGEERLGLSHGNNKAWEAFEVDVTWPDRLN